MQFTKEELVILIEAMSTRIQAYDMTKAVMGTAPTEVQKVMDANRKRTVEMHGRFVVELAAL